jgi:hypothetical protein
MESQLYRESTCSRDAGSGWKQDQIESCEVSWICNVIRETATVYTRNGRIDNIAYCGESLAPHIMESDQYLWSAAELAYYAQLAGEPVLVNPQPTYAWPMAQNTREWLMQRFNMYDEHAEWITTCPACSGYVSTVFGYALPGERDTYMDAQELILRALYLVEKITLPLQTIDRQPRVDICNMVIAYANRVWHSHETGYFSHGDQFKAWLVGIPFSFRSEPECWQFLIHAVILMMAWRDDALDDSAEMIDQIVRLLAV